MVATKTATISGVVRLADGSIPSRCFLAWRPADGQVTGAAIRPDGSFLIPNLPPGQYTLTARVLDPVASQIATAHVALAGSDVTVALTLADGAAARGRITFDQGSDPATLDPSSIVISASPVAAGVLYAVPPRATVHDDWTFEIPGLAGSYQLIMPITPRQWILRSIRISGREIIGDVLDVDGADIEGIEIELTQRIAAITGVVRDARGQPTADAAVVVFAEDRDRSRPGLFLRAVRPDQDGRFMIQRLPAGHYLAVALDFLESGEETNPDTLERLRPLATGVTLTEGPNALDLRVLPAP